MYRMVDCATWDDPWFESLHPKGKLFFLYLLTNPRSTSCGAFEITPRKMAFETGLSVEDVEGFLEKWAPKVQWFPEHNIVFLKNFYRRQANSEKVRVNAARIVAGYPIEVQQAIAIEYPELIESPDTLSIPHAYPTDKQDRDVTETKQDKTETETPPLPPKGEDVVFDELWALAINRNSGVKVARAAFDKAVKRAPPEVILAGFKRHVPVWEKFEDKTKIPHVSTWLNQDRWTVENPIPPSNGRAPTPIRNKNNDPGTYFDLGERYERQGL